MRVSLNTVKQYTDVDVPVDELVQKINQQLGGVEAVIDLGAKYKDAVIVKVVECEKHPDADRLNVTKIDDGGTIKDVPRDENGLVQVVCGAPNVHADMFAIWLPPKSTVPASFEDDEPFVLDARELRGVLSQGMLAAADELAIGSDHAGIVEINPDEWLPSGEAIKPGTNFAKAYGLDDTIIDIENKMFTHRPDLFGQIGVAREIAGILGHAFTSPSWYADAPAFENGSGLELETFNEAGGKVPRIMFAAMKNIEIKPSPLWLQCALVAMGSKAINNIVDVTNYVMLLSAQPTHAYDYDKLRGHKIGARMARTGEKVELLNSKSYELTEEDIVIADGEGPIGLGGIMGGGNSEVSAETKNIVLEVATFDMYAARKSSMRHGIFTDALTRFNKGQSPLQNDHILNLLMMSIKDVSSAEQANGVIDLTGDVQSWPAVEVGVQFINERLGLELTSGQVKTLLENVECRVDGDEMLRVTPPFWRTDIELPEDVVEEVGRLYGFDKLPRELPMRSTKPAPKNQLRELKTFVREQLSRAGANEVLTYSFVHEKVLSRAGQNAKHAFRLSNALSPDLQYYRLSLTPSLLDKVHMNNKAGYEAFALFEMNKTHFKGEMDPDEPEVPNEDTHVAFVLSYGDKKRPDGAAFYHAKKYLEQLTDLGKHELVALSDFDLTADEWGAQLTAPYEPARSALIVKDGQIWGVFGEFTSRVRKAFKLPEFTAGFELHADLITTPSPDYVPLSKYPSTTRDVSFELATETAYDTVYSTFRSEITSTKSADVRTTIDPVSIYQAPDAATKTVTLRVTLTSDDATLRGEDVTQTVDTAADKTAAKISATIV